MKDIIEEEKSKYEKVHTDDFAYGLGKRQLNDLKNMSFEYSKYFLDCAKKSKTSLDIACGGGTIMKYVEDLGVTPAGIDISETAIKKVPEKYRKVVGSCSELPFEDQEFEFVYFLDGLEHIPIKIEKKAISESFRVSKKFVFFAIAMNSSKVRNVELHINIKNQDSWKELLELEAEKNNFICEHFSVLKTTAYFGYRKKEGKQ